MFGDLVPADSRAYSLPVVKTFDLRCPGHERDPALLRQRQALRGFAYSEPGQFIDFDNKPPFAAA